MSLQEKLAALKMAAVGYGLDRVGAGMFGFLEKSVTASKEYTRQLSLMNAAGMTQRDIARATAAAWSTSRDVVTSTAAENLKSIRELRSLFGDQHLAEAYAVLPTVARTEAILEALTGQKQEKTGFEMSKVAELRQTGVMTLPFLQRNVEALSRTLLAMGGTINTNDFLMTMKYAKTAALTFSDQFVYDYLPTLIQEMKTAGGGMMGNASTAGTALSTLYGAIVRGRIPKAAIPMWLATGLIKPSDIVRNATGSFQVRPGGVEAAQLFQENPFFWAQKVAPQLEGYAKAHHLSLIQLITSMFGAKNEQFMMNTLIAKAGQFERDRTLIEGTPSSYEAYQRLLKTNPQLAEQAMHAQWQNLLAQIGYSILPALIPWMQRFARALDSINQFAKDHPTLMKGIVIGLGSFSIALTLLGKVLMTAGLFKFLGLGPMIARAFGALGSVFGLLLTPVGLVSIALVAIGVAAYELWKHWDVVGPKLKAAWAAIRSGLTELGTWMGSKFAGMWDALKSAAGSFFGWFDNKWQWIREHLHLPGSSQAPSAPSARASAPRYAMGEARRSLTIKVPVHLDGKKIAEVTARHLSNALNGPQTGVSFFDGRAALSPAGGTGDY